MERVFNIILLLDTSEEHQHHHPPQEDCLTDVPAFDTELRNSCSIVYKNNCSIQNLTVYNTYEEERCTDPCEGLEKSSRNYETKCQERGSTRKYINPNNIFPPIIIILQSDVTLV